MAVIEPFRTIQIQAPRLDGGSRSFLFERKITVEWIEHWLLSKKLTSFRQSWPWWRWVLTGLSALALALSSYLGWHYLVGGSVIGCGGGSPCDQVLNSRWSSVAGVLPVSGLAAGAYLAMLDCQSFYWSDHGSTGSAAGLARDAGSGRGGCGKCRVVHHRAEMDRWLFLPLLHGHAHHRPAAGGFGHLAGAQATRRRFNSAGPRMFPQQLQGAFLAICPRWVSPRLVWSLLASWRPARSDFVPPAVYRGGESKNYLPAIDPHDVPLLGSPDAPYVVTLLFDYNCPHCQQLHFMLDEAVRRYDGKLAFALCPTPLNTRCNPYIPRDVDEFKDSCELAKIGLAVWVAKREAFPAFDRWMFSFESGDRWQPRQPRRRPGQSNRIGRPGEVRSPPGPTLGLTSICKPPFGFTATPSRMATMPFPNWFLARVGLSPNRMTQTTLF